MSTPGAIALSQRRHQQLRALALLAGAAAGMALPRTAVPATALALALAVGLRSWHKP